MKPFYQSLTLIQLNYSGCEAKDTQKSELKNSGKKTRKEVSVLTREENPGELFQEKPRQSGWD